MPVRPRSAFFPTLFVVFALGIVACGGGGDSDGEAADPAQASGGAGASAGTPTDAEAAAERVAELQQAGTDTIAAGTAAIEGEVNIVPTAGGPEPVTFTIGGTIDLPAHRTALVLDLAHVYGDIEMAPELVPYIQRGLVRGVQDGATAYLCGELYFAFAGAECVREDAGANPGASGAPGAFATGLSFDVLLGLLGELDGAEDVGVERLLATSVRHRAGTLDLAAVAPGMPADARLALDRTLASLGTTVAEVTGPAAVDVWVDGDGLIRQVALEVTGGAHGETRTFVTRFVEFGVDPAIVVPTDAVDAAQVAWP
jgi:hypothetical protein